MLSLFKNDSTTNSVDNLKNPFKKECIKSVLIYSRRNPFNNNEFEHSGDVEFKDGNTSGKQGFKGENIDDVLSQMKAFLINIK